MKKREIRFYNHQRLSMLFRPLFRPVLLFLNRSTHRLVIHRGENLSGVSSRMLKDLPRGIQRAHHLLCRLRQSTGFDFLFRNITGIIQFGGILVPGVVTGIEIRVPHENTWMCSVVFQIPLDILLIKSHFISLIGRHGIQRVESLSVSFL